MKRMNYLSLFSFMFLSLFLFSGCSQKNQTNEKNTNQIKTPVISNETKNNTSTTNVIKQSHKKPVFLSKNKNKYYLSNQKAQSIIPQGYQVLNEDVSINNSRYLILQKGQKVFTYNLKTKKIKNFALPKDKLANNEDIYIYQSISNPDTFLVAIIVPGDISDMEFGIRPEPKNVTTYFYYADTDKTGFTSTDFKLPNTNLNCIKYDSVGERIVYWGCEENSSFLPLTFYGTNNHEDDFVLSVDNFGLKDDEEDQVEIGYSNQSFVVVNKKNGVFKIINTTVQNLEDLDSYKINPITYNMPADIKNAIFKDSDYCYPYFNQSNKVLIANRDNKIYFVKYDENKKAILTKKAEFKPSKDDFGGYYISVNNDNSHIYSSANQKLLSVNLKTLDFNFESFIIPGQIINQIQ